MQNTAGAGNHSSSSDPFAGWPDEHPTKIMYDKYSKLCVEWRQSRVGKSVTAALKKRILNQDDIEVTEVICVGLGSIDRDDSDRTSSIGQLAALACCIDVVKSKHTISNVYFQDPSFRLRDIELLKMLGFSILFDNAAHMLIKATTFLFSAYCPWSEVLCLFSHVKPALFLSSDLFDNHGCSDFITMERLAWSLQQSAIRAFFESRASFAFPFSDTKLDQRWRDKLRDMKLYWPAGKGQKADVRIKKFYEEMSEVHMDELDLADDELDCDELEERMADRDEDSDDPDADETADSWSDVSE